MESALREPRLPAHLKSDCARCHGLCCVASAFEAEQGFGFSKPARTPCRHLQFDFRCRIHEDLIGQGFPACSSFDCHGAGQRVTALFHGRSWRDCPEQAEALFAAYARYRVLHELLAMLALSAGYMAEADKAQLELRFQALEQLCSSGEALTADLALESLRGEVLKQIRDALPRAPAGNRAQLQAAILRASRAG